MTSAIAIGAALAGVLALVGLGFWLARRAGAADAKREAAEGALQHTTETAGQVSRSDEAVADPRNPRGARVRRMFERPDG